MLRTILILGCAFGAFLAPREIGAECDRPRSLERFARGVERAVHCRETPGVVCRRVERTSCVGDAVEDWVELVEGAAPEALPRRDAASKCHRAIRRATGSYVQQRVSQRIDGVRGAPRERLLKRVERACTGIRVAEFETGRLPGVGGRCAPLLDPGGEIDAGALARCLSASVEKIVDDVSPARLRPNIVLVLTDDQEERSHSIDLMPETLERVADQGLRFENGFVTTPVCGPSRASLLSGQYASHHRILHNTSLVFDAHRFDEDQTVGRWLQDAGYRTAFLGKYQNWIFAREPHVPKGWDEWRVFRNPRYYDYTLNENGTLVDHGAAPEDYSTDVLAAKAVEFIEDHHEEPFFLVLSVLAPHTPAIPADRHRGALADLPPSRPPNFQPADLTGKPAWVRLLRGRGDRPEVLDRLRIDMLETLLSVDEAVARILDALESHGLSDNTLVVFTSDNGLHLGAHWWSGKWTGYEESLRVPFVVRYPVLAPIARTEAALVLNIDLAPTFAELAGVAPGIDVDGASLVELVEGGPPVRERFAFESFDSVVVRPMWGVRDQDFKYIQQTGSSFEELYDLDDDPWELHNRASEPAYGEELARRREQTREILGGF